MGGACGYVAGHDAEVNCIAVIVSDVVAGGSVDDGETVGDLTGTGSDDPVQVTSPGDDPSTAAEDAGEADPWGGPWCVVAECGGEAEYYCAGGSYTGGIVVL